MLSEVFNMKNSEWVQDKEDRVTALEQTLVAANLGTFVGTMEEYKDAVTNGIIKDGMIIAISAEK